MKRNVISLIIIMLIIFINTPATLANDEYTTITIQDDTIQVNGETITPNTTERVYLTNTTNNGGTSKLAIEANEKVENIINISQAGIYEITGTSEDCQISIDVNNISEDIKLILNNVNITCKEAPAIMIYRKDIERDDCNVTISLAENSVNTIVGDRIKEEINEWEDKDKLAYYTTKEFDKKKRAYVQKYKYNGAISSDTSLTFEGTGRLNVISYKKEGIESKRNITFNGGAYNITAMDDAINSTYEYEGFIDINDGTIVTNVFEAAEEGDGIDANGRLNINGGTIYAFSYSSIENGFDSITGVNINGGSLFSIGKKCDEKIYTDNGRKVIQENFENMIPKGETIVVVDENEKAIFAFKTDRDFQTFAYSSEDLQFDTYKVYVGNEIPKKLSYTLLDLEAIEKSENKEIDLEDIKYIEINKENNIKQIVLVILIAVTIVLVVVAIICIVVNKQAKSKNKKKRGDKV